jgi:hypothetical protein
VAVVIVAVVVAVIVVAAAVIVAAAAVDAANFTTFIFKNTKPAGRNPGRLFLWKSLHLHKRTIMSTRELRHNISSLLEKTEDAELMQSILILLRKSLALPAPGIAAYEADGTPISEDDLVASILGSREEIRLGKKIALADLKKELLAE